MATDLSKYSSWRAAQAAAAASGWVLAATGDWSWLYRSPDRSRAWKITPFDPAFRVFADICLESSNRHLPRLEGIADHSEGGFSVLMEWLDPVSKIEAEEWLAGFEHATDATAANLFRLLENAAGRIELPLFAGIDKNPANVLRRPADGTIVLTDAYWINGPVLYEMMQSKPQDALALYPAAALEQWAHLPCMDEQATALILAAIDR